MKPFLAQLLPLALILSACDDDTDGSASPSDDGTGGDATTGVSDPATDATGAGITTSTSSDGSTTAEPDADGADGADGDGADDMDVVPPNAAFVIGSVVIDPDNNRTTYVQVVESLDAGPFTNDNAIEVAGNAVVMASRDAVFVGLTEEPTWVRYDVTEELALEETGRLSLLNLGAASIGFASTIVDDTHAVTVVVDQGLAAIWNPSTMEIEGEVELDHLNVEGFSLEAWTTTAHDGLVYIPGRWADWEGGSIRPVVSTTIVDPEAMEVVGVAEDDRCASGGHIVFDDDGYGYVMGDGRNYIIQMFANAAGQTPPENCILRIAPGETDFEEDFYVSVPSLTEGLESITELGTVQQGSGIGFAKMFYPDELPEGVEPVDYDFWDEPAHKMWTIELGDEPTARAVEGLPFSAVGFTPSTMGGKLYVGEYADGQAEVYEIDPETNSGSLRFTMDGYLFGLHAVTP